ncbi:MAG TPA: phosphopantetheine-binding protein [Cyclobacteriaceae bacterium]|jgi:acyl carrier protein
MEQLMQTLKVQIIEALNLRHLKPEDIKDDEPLFVEGVGLDSIDALELIVLLQQHYGVKVEDPSQGPQIFRSVKSMAEYIENNKKPQSA